jgi:hypothetical protein
MKKALNKVPNLGLYSFTLPKNVVKKPFLVLKPYSQEASDEFFVKFPSIQFRNQV